MNAIEEEEKYEFEKNPRHIVSPKRDGLERKEIKTKGKYVLDKDAMDKEAQKKM